MSGDVDDLFSAIIQGVLHVLWFCLVYSPFVIVGGGASLLAYRHFDFHGLVDLSIGVFSGFMLFFLVLFIERRANRMKRRDHEYWKLVKGVNIFIVCGTPFAFGAYFASNWVAAQDTAVFEYIIAALAGGLILSVPAYFTVFRHLKDWDDGSEAKPGKAGPAKKSKT